MERKDDPPKVQLGDRCSWRCCGRESFLLGLISVDIKRLSLFFKTTFIILSYSTLLSMIRYCTTLISSLCIVIDSYNPKTSRGAVVDVTASLVVPGVDVEKVNRCQPPFLGCPNGFLGRFFSEKNADFLKRKMFKSSNYICFVERKLWMNRVKI